MAVLSSDIDFQEVWTRIRQTVRKLITLNHVDKNEWIVGIHDVYELCVATPDSFAEELYSSTEKLLLDLVKEFYEMVTSWNKQFLMSYYLRWSTYIRGIYYLTLLYKHLTELMFCEFSEFELAIENRTMLYIVQLGLVMWRKHVIEPMKNKLLQLLLDSYRLDRDGVIPNIPIHFGFRAVMESFVQVERFSQDNLEFYRENFEKPFVKATGEYYKLVASRLLQENNCSEYMEKVVQKLKEEDDRSRKNLRPSSYAKVIQECKQSLVSNQLELMLGESKKMIEEENKKDLRHMYILLKSFPSAIKTLTQELQQHITETGKEAITAVGGRRITQAFVERFIAVNDKFSCLIESVFSGDHRFVAALNKAGISIINHNWNPKFKCQAPELLAKYCDSLLKKSVKSCSEEEIENKLNNAIKIFKYIEDKDVFQKIYSRNIANRLIFKQSLSMDAEETMIKKLTETAGYNFTKNLHLMFNDVNISADLNISFTEYKDSLNLKLGISFSIHVLQNGAWPFVETNSTFSISEELEKSIKTFDSFYKTKFNGRKLTWLHHMCNAELKLCYLKKPYIVSMSTYQMAILLLFERTDDLTYEEIAENTKLSEETLQNQMKSLLKSKLILSSKREKSFKDGSSFRLNKKYTNKRTKFSLPLADEKETTRQEEGKARSSVVIDRKMFVRAAIVRTMKERKVLKHNILIQEVINQAEDRFVPEVPMIKKCIEWLIEKEYIKRTPDTRGEYSYVA